MARCLTNADPGKMGHPESPSLVNKEKVITAGDSIKSRDTFKPRHHFLLSLWVRLVCQLEPFSNQLCESQKYVLDIVSYAVLAFGPREKKQQLDPTYSSVFCAFVAHIVADVQKVPRSYFSCLSHYVMWLSSRYE